MYFNVMIPPSQEILEAMMDGDIQALNEIEWAFPGFLEEREEIVGPYWITNAIQYGNYDVVEWVISKGVKLNFKAKDGYSVLHSAINAESKDKYRIMRLLILHGADMNVCGVNDYTPAHLAAVRNDVKALKILFESGANMWARTKIDNIATPLEEARSCGGGTAAVAFLRQIEHLKSDEFPTMKQAGNSRPC